jgi:hypothetical protein
MASSTLAPIAVPLSNSWEQSPISTFFFLRNSYSFNVLKAKAKDLSGMTFSAFMNY